MKVIMNVPFYGTREYLDDFDPNTIPKVGETLSTKDVRKYVVKNKTIIGNECTLDLVLESSFWYKGKPNKSGSYLTRYNGIIGRDDYTTSGGGHWWNVGEINNEDEVEYNPDSYISLGE